MKQGWENRTLGDVLDVLRNGVNCKQDKKGVGDKISRIESISNAYFDIDKVGFAILSKSDKEKYRLAKGDILFSHINSPIHVGKTGLFNSDEEVYHGVNLLLMRPKPFLDGNYFEHFLKFLFQNGYWKGLCKQSVNQASVNQQDINKVKISFPKSLPEQQRIVSILDESFAAIDKAKSNAEQNLKNAKELFESYLQGVFENGNWEKKPLKELTLKIGSGATPRGGQENYKSEGISLVRSMNVHDWEFRERNLAFIDEKQAKELDGVTLQEYDVLLNITGASVARCCVFPKEYLPARVNQHVSIIRPKKDILDARFLNLLLTSKPYKDQLLFTGEQGATRQAITKAQIETFQVAFPSLKEQNEIVKKLDNIILETNKLETIYQQKINDLEELKKSILQKAFAGELKTEKELA
jgi:type I restriction enzyme S subunit